MPNGGVDIGPAAREWIVARLNEVRPAGPSGVFATLSQVWNENFASFCYVTLYLKAGGSGGVEWEDGTIVNPTPAKDKVPEKLQYPWVPVGFWNGNLYGKPDYLFGVQVKGGAKADPVIVWNHRSIKSERYWIEKFLNENSPKDVSEVRGFISQNRPGADYDIHVFCRRNVGGNTQWKNTASNYTGSEKDHADVIRKIDSGRWCGLALYLGDQTHVLVGAEH